MSANPNALYGELIDIDNKMKELEIQRTKSFENLEEQLRPTSNLLYTKLKNIESKIHNKNKENKAKPAVATNTYFKNRYGQTRMYRYNEVMTKKKQRLQDKRKQLYQKEPMLERPEMNTRSENIQKKYPIITLNDIKYEIKRYLDFLESYKNMKPIYVKEVNTKKNKLKELETILDTYAPKSIVSRFARKNTNRKAQAIDAAARVKFDEVKKTWNNQKKIRETLNQYEKESLLPYLEELKSLYNDYSKKQEEFNSYQQTIRNKRGKLSNEWTSKFNTLKKNRNTKQKTLNRMVESLNPEDFKSIFEAAGFTYQPVTYKEVKKYRNSGSWYAAQGYYDNSYIEREEQPDYFYYELTRPYNEGDPIPEGWVKKEETYISGYNKSYHGYQGQYESKTPRYKIRTFLQRSYPSNLPAQYQGALYRNKWLGLRKFLQSANRT